MKIAALQLDCLFADINSNMRKIEKYIREAKSCGVGLILLPEFFPSAIGFAPQMNRIALEGVHIRETIKKFANENGIIIGGSYLLFDGVDSHNTFDLVFPDGAVFTHQKDIPTQFENCYYTNGDENNILHTPIGDFGVAMCWEMIRYDTLRRIAGKADIVLAGSCWWDLPMDAPLEREPLRLYNQRLALETPITFAKMLHVPVIHANHCGKATSYNFPKNDRLQTRRFVGAAQIIDPEGVVIERLEFGKGEGLIISEIPLSNKQRHAVDINTSKYWIPDLPDPYLKAWQEINPIAKSYYREYMLPYYKAYGTKTRGI